MDVGLAGATVCVQGGTRGIGRAVAELCAGSGARVAVTGRDAEVAAVAARLAELGSPDSVGLVIDLSRPTTVTRAFAELTERWPQLNALVNVAGPPVVRAGWDELDDDRWLAAFEVGALGAVRCARAARPALLAAEWARIVNVSAVSARVQSAGLAAYSAAKAALNSIGKTMALELAPYAILVNTVSPGAVLSSKITAELQARGQDGSDPVAALEVIRERHDYRADLGRVAEAADVARVICYLASAANTYVTGANINVDGGSAFA